MTEHDCVNLGDTEPINVFAEWRILCKCYVIYFNTFVRCYFTNYGKLIYWSVFLISQIHFCEPGIFWDNLSRSIDTNYDVWFFKAYQIIESLQSVCFVQPSKIRSPNFISVRIPSSFQLECLIITRDWKFKKYFAANITKGRFSSGTTATIEAVGCNKRALSYLALALSLQVISWKDLSRR